MIQRTWNVYQVDEKVVPKKVTSRPNNGHPCLAAECVYLLSSGIDHELPNP